MIAGRLEFVCVCVLVSVTFCIDIAVFLDCICTLLYTYTVVDICNSRFCHMDILHSIRANEMKCQEWRKRFRRTQKKRRRKHHPLNKPLRIRVPFITDTLNTVRRAAPTTTTQITPSPKLLARNRTPHQRD